VDVTGQTVTVGDPLVDPTDGAPMPLGVDAISGENQVVVGEPTAPVTVEVVLDPPPDPALTTPPADAGGSVGDSTASAVAPVVTVEPDVTVCGNAAGILGDASAECAPEADAGTTGTGTEGGSFDLALGEPAPLAGTTLEGDLPSAVADPEVVVCGHAVGVLGDGSGTCAPGAGPASVAEAGSLGGALGGDTPVSGTAAGGELPGVVAEPDAMACGNGAAIGGDASGSCTPATSPEPLDPITSVGLDVIAGGTTPLTGSSAAADLSSTTVDPDATACGNGVGLFGDASGGCGATGGAVPGVPVVPVEPPAAAGLTVELSPLGDVGLADLPSGQSGTPAVDAPDDGSVSAGPVTVGLSGGTTPVGPGAPAPPSPSGVGTAGALTPIGVGPAGGIVPLGLAGTVSADLAAAGTLLGDVVAGMGNAALALTGFGIRNTIGIASVLLALGALLLAGRRRVELAYCVS